MAIQKTAAGWVNSKVPGALYRTRDHARLGAAPTFDTPAPRLPFATCYADSVLGADHAEAIVEDVERCHEAAYLTDALLYSDIGLAVLHPAWCAEMAAIRERIYLRSVRWVNRLS